MYFKTVERANPLKREEKLFYPQPVWNKQIDENALATEISYASSINASDIRAVISSLTELIPRHLMDGNTVKLDGFGIFRLSFESKGELNEEDVSDKDILQTKVLFRPDVKIKSKLKSTICKKSASPKSPTKE